MRRTSLLLTLCASLAGSAALAQVPAAPPVEPGPMAMGMDPAGMLLARTGELQLTDAQVVRLAAISRRTADRRRAMRASFDSIRPPVTAGRPDSAARAAMRARFEGMRTRMQQARDAQHTDLRDAIAVLTADQQARAWEMMAAHRRGPMGPGRRGFGGGMRPRFGAPEGPGAPGGARGP